MRSAHLLILLAFAAACGGDRGAALASGPAAPWSGPDAVLVRLPKGGGPARAYRWGRDSVLWTSTQPVPSLSHVVAFDPDQGTVVYADARGVPGRVELRLGTVGPATNLPMSDLVSADGWAVFGINTRREVQRLTPADSWIYRSAFTPRELLPQPDGSLVLMNDLGDRSVLRRLHPPETRTTDTASVPKAAFAVPTTLGDRIYFATDSGLAGVRVRDLGRTRTIPLPGPASAAAPTPSGDRVYVAMAVEPEIVIINRYDERVEGSIAMGARIASLRMDPDGRYLLARFEDADTVAVVSVAEARVVSVVASPWRADLPLVAPDGALLIAAGPDAVDLDPMTGKIRRRFAGGADDLWSLVRWNGFRPRAKGLDKPVEFDADSADTVAVTAPGADPGELRPPTRTAAPPPDAPARGDERVAAAAAAEPSGWTLSFAALLDERRARALAGTIRIDAHPVRVIPGERDGTTIWRVVSGPYASRADAERAGRRTGLPFWVYEDDP